jgi:hypothetical protein
MRDKCRYAITKIQHTITTDNNKSNFHSLIEKLIESHWITLFGQVGYAHGSFPRLKINYFPTTDSTHTNTNSKSKSAILIIRVSRDDDGIQQLRSVLENITATADSNNQLLFHIFHVAGSVRLANKVLEKQLQLLSSTHHEIHQHEKNRQQPTKKIKLLSQR